MKTQDGELVTFGEREHEQVLGLVARMARAERYARLLEFALLVLGAAALVLIWTRASGQGMALFFGFIAVMTFVGGLIYGWHRDEDGLIQKGPAARGEGPADFASEEETTIIDAAVARVKAQRSQEGGR